LKLPLSELPTFEIACFCSYSTPFEITPFWKYPFLEYPLLKVPAFALDLPTLILNNFNNLSVSILTTLTTEHFGWLAWSIVVASWRETYVTYTIDRRAKFLSYTLSNHFSINLQTLVFAHQGAIRWFIIIIVQTW
jgi:hypothetical protein